MSEREKRYQEAIKQGHSAAWDQDWERAATYYRQALAEQHEDPKALTNLALALFKLQDYEEALQLYTQLIKKNPTDPVPLEKAAILYEILGKPEVGSTIAVRTAELYLKSGDIEKAIENWTRALGMNPENLAAHSRLALVYERMKRVSQAVREYLHIASLMQHAGERNKAAQALNRALSLAPNHDEVHQALAMLRENVLLPKPTRPQKGTGPIRESQVPMLDVPKEKPEKALTPIEEAEEKALAALASLFFDQDNEDRIAQPTRSGGLQSIVDGTGIVLSKGVDHTQLRLHLGQAVEYLTSGNSEGATVELERVTEIGLNHPAAFFQLGLLRLESDRLESALRSFRRSVGHSDYALGSRLLMAAAYRMKEQVKLASIEYLEALSLADSLIVPSQYADGLRQLYEPLIETHKQTGSDQQSAQICKTISDILERPQWLHYLQNIRTELLPNNDDHPSPLAEVLTEASSSQVVVAMSQIRQLVREGRIQAAFEEALFALQDAPTYLPLHIAIGDLLISSNQMQVAIEKFTVIARSYSVRGEVDRAIDMLHRVVDMSPMDFDLRNQLIDLLIANDKPADVLEELMKLAELQYSLAELSEARKTYARTLRYVRQSSLHERQQVRILHRIADIDMQMLNWRQALTLYQQICTIQPDDLNANQSLIDLNFRLGERAQAIGSLESFVRTLSKSGRSGDAIKILEKLENDWPQQAMIKNYLADQYKAEGRTQDALEKLDAAGDILLEAGNRESAIQVILKIIDLNPPNIEKYQQLLRDIQSL